MQPFPWEPGEKVHPASREMLADDPLALCGRQLPGDSDLMLRLVVEEFARIGYGSAEIERLALDPHYQAFAGLRARLGEEEIRRRIREAVARCGVVRVRTVEAPTSETTELVQLEIPQVD